METINITNAVIAAAIALAVGIGIFIYRRKKATK